MRNKRAALAAGLRGGLVQQGACSHFVLTATGELHFS